MADELIKFGVIAVVGYFAWEYVIGPAIAGSTTTATPIGTTTTAAPPPPSSTSNAIAAGASPNQLLAIASGNPLTNGILLLNASQWNYYMTKLTGIPSWALGDNGQPMDVNTYYSLLMSTAGLHGLGLGHIIDLSNLFAGSTLGSGFGEQEFSALSGLGVIEDDALMSAGYIDEGPFNEAAAWAGSQLDVTTADFYAAAAGQGT